MGNAAVGELIIVRSDEFDGLEIVKRALVKEFDDAIFAVAEEVAPVDDDAVAAADAQEAGEAVSNAIMEAAAKNKSDVIIQFSNSGGQFYAGKSLENAFEAKVLGSISAARHIHLLAEKYGICTIIHTDHANKALIPFNDSGFLYGDGL